MFPFCLQKKHYRYLASLIGSVFGISKLSGLSFGFLSNTPQIERKRRMPAVMAMSLKAKIILPFNVPRSVSVSVECPMSLNDSLSKIGNRYSAYRSDDDFMRIGRHPNLEKTDHDDA